MEAKDLIIGNEYFLNARKTVKGIYVGQGKTKGIYFKIEGKHNYLTQNDENTEFCGCVGFTERTVILIPVE